MENAHWSIDNGYGVKPHSVFRNAWMALETLAKPSGPKIIKLHGSVN